MRSEATSYFPWFVASKLYTRIFVSKKTLSFMKLVPGPCLWSNPNWPFFHQVNYSIHGLLVLFVMVDQVFQLTSHKFSQGRFSLLTDNPGLIENVFVERKGQISSHVHPPVLTYYVKKDSILPATCQVGVHWFKGFPIESGFKGSILVSGLHCTCRFAATAAHPKPETWFLTPDT